MKGIERYKLFYIAAAIFFIIAISVDKEKTLLNLELKSVFTEYSIAWIGLYLIGRYFKESDN